MESIPALEEVFTDTPQFRGGNPYFFCENLYQSVSFIYAYRDAVYKKNRDIVKYKIDSQQQRTKIRALPIGLLHVARQSDQAYASD